MALNSDLVDVVDQRIAAVQEVTRQRGTVSARSTSFYSTWVSVTMDGSALAVPVKILADVLVEPGDRVVLEKFGADWVVTGTFVRRWLADTGIASASNGGSTSSGTYADLPAIATLTFPFSKHFDETRLKLDIRSGAYASAGTPGLYLGIKIYPVGNPGAAVTTNVTFHRFNDTFIHEECGGLAWIPGIAAGDYTAVCQWKTAGAGTVAQSTDDWTQGGVKEVAP